MLYIYDTLFIVRGENVLFRDILVNWFVCIFI